MAIVAPRWLTTNTDLPPHAENRQALWGRGTVVAATVDEGILCKSTIFNFPFLIFNYRNIWR